ncbi:MAG TPA: hypothetical protein VHT28_07050 [Silvibacterium sp.]|nr:hypothetical protein [Silvibacterium sp.]
MRNHLLAVWLLSGAVLLGHGSAVAQDGSKKDKGAQASASQNSQDNADQDIDMLRKDIRYQKRQLVATNVPLTEGEAKNFWPVFDQYTAELVQINNEKYALIKDYTQSYETMTDAQADDWAKRALKLDADVAALRQKYWLKFRAVLPAKKTALYEQVERRTQMVIDVQLASQFPLIQPK